MVLHNNWPIMTAINFYLGNFRFLATSRGMQ